MNQLEPTPSSEGATPPPRDDYHAYLLRIWRVLGNEGAHWRASLENVQTGELRGFEDIEGLQRFLEALADAEGVEAPQPGPSPDG